MNTHDLPGLAPGSSPNFARRRTSSGCILRKVAACLRSRVFMACLAAQIDRSDLLALVAELL